MNLRRCENGHFYDADKFEACPHCSGLGGDTDVTMNFKAGPEAAIAEDMTEVFAMDSDSRFQEGPANTGSLLEAVNVAMTRGKNQMEDDSKTIGIYSNFGKEPVVGWLVCIEGKTFGQSYSLKTGRNFIGRNPGMDVCLREDISVSRDRHAIVLYEPKRREFIAQAGDSRELFYVNDDVVLMPRKLNRHDILSVGNTKLMFFPCCDETFSWDDYKQEGKQG